MVDKRNCPWGEILREWRGLRGFSQLDLSLVADVSSRHISFLETGRSRPSRDMVLRLAESLAVPLRERNRMLGAAGFSALYSELSLDDRGLAMVRRAVETLLKSHEPYPAFAVDRTWTIVLANDAHHRLLARFLPVGESGEPTNAMELVLDPTQLRPHIPNWEDVARVLGYRIQRQLRLVEPNSAVCTKLESLLAQPGVRAAITKVRLSPESDILLPLVLELDGQRLSWFTTIATIGTPQDVTLEELSIESFFPADEETRQWIEANGAGPSVDLRGGD